MKICNAVTSDVKEIYSLIEVYAKEGVVLPRSLLSLYQYLQCLYVMKEDERIVGVAGLHVLGRSCRNTIVSSFAYICRERDRAYARKSCNGGSYENKCKKSNFLNI